MSLLTIFCKCHRYFSRGKTIASVVWIWWGLFLGIMHFFFFWLQWEINNIGYIVIGPPTQKAPLKGFWGLELGQILLFALPIWELVVNHLSHHWYQYTYICIHIFKCVFSKSWTTNCHHPEKSITETDLWMNEAQVTGNISSCSETNATEMEVQNIPWRLLWFLNPRGLLRQRFEGQIWLEANLAVVRVLVYKTGVHRSRCCSVGCGKIGFKHLILIKTESWVHLWIRREWRVP